jgi:hypothetical protein
MPPLDRKHMEALYEVFKDAALEDQRRYYQRAVSRNRQAAAQVNRWRAAFALLTGLASALAGLIIAYAVAGGTLEQCNTSGLSVVAANGPTIEIQVTPQATLTPEEQSAIASGQGAPQPNCTAVNVVVPLLLVVAVVAPALGAAFTTLADLYQWDRLITVYDVALENLEVADAQSPLPAMDDVVYRAALRAYSEGTLSVMRDETAQWGQLIKTPESLDQFIAQEAARAEAAAQSAAQRVESSLGASKPPPSSSGGSTG